MSPIIVVVVYFVLLCDAVTNWNYLATIPDDQINLYNPKVAFWNDELVILNDGYMLYTQFLINNTNWNQIELVEPLNWTVTSIPDISEIGCCDTFHNIGQFNTQIENILYAQPMWSATNMVIFNISSKAFMNISTYNSTLPVSDQDCITNNITHLFIMGDYSINLYLYDIANDKWSVSDDHFDVGLRTQACAVTNDLSELFVYGGYDGSFHDIVSKYDIENDQIITLNVTLNANDYSKQAINTNYDTIYVLDSGTVTKGYGQIFDVQTQQFRESCLFDNIYDSSSFYHSQTNSIIIIDGNHAPNQITYLSIDLYLTFSEYILLSNTTIIHPNKQNIICTESSMFWEPIIISTDFPVFDFSWYIEAVNDNIHCILCDDVEDCYKCNYIKDENQIISDNTFSIEANQRAATASICQLLLYPTTNSINGDNTLYLDFNITNCDHLTFADNLNIQYNAMLVVNGTDTHFVQNIIINNVLSSIILQQRNWSLNGMINGIIDVDVISDHVAVINSSFPFYLCDIVDFSASNTIIQPGQTFTVKHQLLHSNRCNTDKSFDIELKSTPLNIDYKIVIINDECRLCKVQNYNDPLTDCSICQETEIYPEIIEEETENLQYTLSLYSQDVFLMYDHFNVLIKICELGYGIDTDVGIAFCELCVYNSFSFKGTYPCYHCPVNDDENDYECLGAEGVNIKYNYWISAISENNTNNNNLYPLYDVISSDSIVSSICPAGYCCQDKDGCNYYRNYMNYTQNGQSMLCAKGRNLSTIFCSKCINGFYEMIGSNECGICEDTNYLYIALLFLVAALFAMFIIFIYSKPDTMHKKQDEINWGKMLIKDDVNLSKLLLFKILMYFYQSLSQILYTKGLSPSSQFENSLLSIFNFEILSSTTSATSDGICLIGQISSGLYEILVSYLYYIFLFIIIMIIGILNQFFKRHCSLGMLCCCCKSNKVKDKLSEYQPFIKIGIINLIIMFSGAVLSTSFKIITCIQDFSGNTMHFHDATKHCFSGLWFIGLIIIFCIISFWIWLFIAMKKQSKEHQELDTNPFKKLLKQTRQNTWFWEFVLFSRRFLIALLTSFGYLEPDSINLVLITVLIIFCCLQSYYSPFIYGKANLMEFLCLFGLTTIMATINFSGSTKFISIYSSIWIIAPFILLLWIMLKVLYRWIIVLKDKGKVDWNKEAKNLGKIKNRMPESYRIWLESELQQHQNRGTENVDDDQTPNPETIINFEHDPNIDTETVAILQRKSKQKSISFDFDKSSNDDDDGNKNDDDDEKFIEAEIEMQ